MHFIIYEDDDTYINIYKKVIMKLMGDNNINYNILKFYNFL